MSEYGYTEKIAVHDSKKGIDVKQPVTYAWWMQIEKDPKLKGRYVILGKWGKQKNTASVAAKVAPLAPSNPEAKKKVVVPAEEKSATSNDEAQSPVVPETEPAKSETLTKEPATAGKAGITQTAIEATNDADQLKAWAKDLGVSLGNTQSLNKIKDKLIAAL